ncbi:MAG: gliding motility-associated C-terminal domain-containing protein [Prolixibacteraceae bacterium]|nr:gliding motility-associated C-terminal domain-containing protein [Prolixibacteraceae bacterium]
MKTTLPLFSRTALLAMLFSTFFIIQSSTTKAQQGRELDSLSLVGLYTAFYGDVDWNYHQGWLEEGVPISEWRGVTVDSVTGRVTALRLPDNNIHAEFPEKFDEDALLDFIAYLFSRGLDFDRYTTLYDIVMRIIEIPGAPLGELRIINLSDNDISGHIPEDIDEIAYLQELNLSKNEFEGTIPEEIGNLEHLNVLNLGQNFFNGGLNHVCNIESLIYLDLRNNLFSGSLPPQLWELTNLQHLSLRKNFFNGQISGDIQNLVNLTTLNLSANQFSGEIPDAFESLTQLSQLLLHQNYFAGNVPTSMGEIPSLMNLNISDNLLENLPELTNVWNDFLCYWNYFTFEDFEPSVDMLNRVTRDSIHPQHDFGEERDTTAQAYLPFSISIPCGGANNRYTWYKNGEYHSGPFDTDTLYFSSIQWDDAGDYTVKVENTIVNNLILQSKVTTIHIIEYSCLYADSMALVAFYHATDGPHWTENTNWLVEGQPVSTWHGITLSEDGCNVTRIELDSNNLVGSIPPDIGDFPELTDLDLRGNRLTGQIPEEIGNLALLTDLNLGWNFLSGPIPDEIGYLSELQVLSIHDNQLTGTIPTQICELSNLNFIQLGANQLTGSIPPEIGDLINLEYLSLGTNQLTGNIPSSISDLENLVWLNLAENNLEGDIPSDIGNLQSLTSMNLQNNDLSGPIPASFGQLINLKWLDMGGNQLSGPIPDEFWDMSSLENLYLGDNELEGNLSPLVDNLTELTYIDLTENLFTGQIPEQLGNISTLEGIVLRNNQFSGDVPESIGTLANLRDFRIENNRLDGLWPLPQIDSIFSCSNNYFTFEDFENNLHLFDDDNLEREVAPQYEFEAETTITIIEGNELTLSRLCGGTANHYVWWKDGEEITNDSPDLFFPSVELTDEGDYWVTVTSEYGFDNLELTSKPIHLIVEEHCLKQDSLALVALYDATDGDNWNNNNGWLTGPVSTWYGIEGLTPDGCNVTRIELLFNNLTGTIPPEIGNLNSLSHLIIDNNNLSGEIPPEIGSLQALEILKLNDNRLTGPLPNSLYDLHNLKELNLTNNLLNGTISTRLGELTNLRFLSFEANLFGGEIPHEIGNLKELRFFSIAHTPFSGTVPEEIGELSELTFLNFYKTGLHGSLPESLTQLAKLDTFNIQLCRFSGHIPNFSSLDELTYFNAANNLFLFGDIDAGSVNTGQLEFTYAPQDTVLHLEELYESRQITIIDDDFSGNVYHWYLNDVLYEEGSDVLDLTETGMYYCHVTNPAFPELTLYSDTLNIYEIMPYYDDVEPVNLVIIDGSHPPEFHIKKLELYPDNSLVLFNRWGQKVYERSSYNNDLDFSEYAEGTYYYVLNYVKPDGPKQIKSFVDVVKE